MPGFYATIAHYYDAEHTDKTDDLIFYSELAEEHGGPIFEVGCGTGRVMMHLAQEGYELHGIDSEIAMLDIARFKLDRFPFGRDKLKFYHGDVLTYELEKQFKLVLLSYNSLMHFHEQADQITLLEQLRRWTAPGGLLVIDLPNAGEAFAAPDSDNIALERTFIEAETGHLVMQQANSYLDRVEQLMRVNWIYDEVTGDGTVRRTLAPVVFRYFFFAEMKLLLQQTGFRVQTVYGNTERGPFEDGCERMIILAEPA